MWCWTVNSPPTTKLAITLDLERWQPSKLQVRHARKTVHLKFNKVLLLLRTSKIDIWISKAKAVMREFHNCAFTNLEFSTGKRCQFSNRSLFRSCQVAIAVVAGEAAMPYSAVGCCEINKHSSCLLIRRGILVLSVGWPHLKSTYRVENPLVPAEAVGRWLLRS